MKIRKLRKPVKKVTVKKKDHTSNSQIVAGQCKLYYKDVYLNRKKNSGNVYTEGGKFVHKVLCDYTKHCVEDKIDGDFEKIEEIIVENYKLFVLPENLFSELRQICLNFAENGLDFDIILDYECDHTISYDSTNPEKKHQVIIDKINSYMTEGGSVLEIIDYKNEQKIRTPAQVLEDQQLIGYVWACVKHLFKGYQFIRWGIQNTRYNKIIWSHKQPIPISEVSKLVEDYENSLHRQWDRLIVSNNFEPEKSNLCWAYSGCPIMLENKCPLYTKAEVKRMTGGTIDDVVRALRKSKMEVEVLEDKLKNIFENRAPKMVDGIEVGYLPAESEHVEISDMITYCKEKGIPVQGVPISVSIFDKLIKKIFELRGIWDDDEKYRKICRSSVKTVFRYK